MPKNTSIFYSNVQPACPCEQVEQCCRPLCNKLVASCQSVLWQIDWITLTENAKKCVYREVSKTKKTLMSLPSLCEHFISFKIFIYHPASVILTQCILFEFEFFVLFWLWCQFCLMQTVTLAAPVGIRNRGNTLLDNIGKVTFAPHGPFWKSEFPSCFSYSVQ